jgi:uncharacterized protein (UPF0297 family)
MVIKILKEFTPSIYPPCNVIGGYYFSGDPAASVNLEDAGS